MAEFQQHSHRRREHDVAGDVPHKAQPQERDAEVAELLDDIDSILEENSQTFVRSFVQKGGQ